jgi:hypothetical protein
MIQECYKAEIHNKSWKIWKVESFVKEKLTEEQIVLMDKAKQTCIEIPVGKENAITKEILIEKIIASLTYTI